MSNSGLLIGQWWVEGEGNPSYAGELDCSAETFRLKIWKIHQRRKNLIECLIGSNEERFQDFPQTIRGVDINNKPITLFGCSLTRSSISGGMELLEIDPLAIVKGLRVECWGGTIARAVMFKPAGLHRWLDRKLLNLGKSSEGRPVFSLEDELNQEFPIMDGVRIRIFESVAPSFSLDEHKFGHDTQIWFHFDAPRSLEEITEQWMPWLSQLLGLLIGTPLSMGEMQIFPHDPFQPSYIPDHGVLITPNSIKSAASVSAGLNTQNIVVPFDLIKGQLAKVFLEWHRVISSFKPVVELFDVISQRRSLHIEARFLFLVQALEIYHASSSKFVSTELPREERIVVSIRPNSIFQSIFGNGQKESYQ